MKTGTVIRFNKIKGYGFIAPTEGDTEIFVHFSEILTEGYKELKEGQKVNFELIEGERGLAATKVNVLK